MNNIYAQRAELSEAQEKIKEHQNTLLDAYDPKNARLNALLTMLVGLEQELESLDEEFETLQQ
jgi:predicted nuclease with TOPRIM domain